MTSTDPGRELWDERRQTKPMPDVRAEARSQLATEWSRPWDQPITYYRDKFAAAGYDPHSMPPLDEIPRTTKDQLREDVAQHPPFGSHRGISLAQAIRMGSSTGTTGKPWLTLYTGDDLERWLPIRLGWLWRAGVRPGGRFSHSWPLGLYSTGVLGGRDFLALGVMEISCGPPSTPTDINQHLDVWEALRPTNFMLTGSQLSLYEEAAKARGLELRKLLADTSVLFSEASCQFEGPRHRLEHDYGFRLHNISGASEVMAFSLSDCRFHTGLHVPIGHHIVQVCDPETGHALPPGERGTLVISSFGLDSYCMRYDVQDLVVEHSEPCPCGETGQRYTYLGRIADLAEIEGLKILPLDVQLALDQIGGPEFQLRPGPGAVLDIRLEVQGSGTDVAGHLKETLGIPVRVEPVPVGSLPRSAFKARRSAAT